MNTKKFIKNYVSQNGAARVMVNGSYLRPDELCEGAVQVSDFPVDIYVVNDTGADVNIAREADAVLISSVNPINDDPNEHPIKTLSDLGFSFAGLSDKLFAFTKNGLPHEAAPVVPESDPESSVPEPVVNTTIPPAPDVPLSISGGEEEPEEEVDEEVDDDVEDDVDEDDSTNKGMVW